MTRNQAQHLLQQRLIRAGIDPQEARIETLRLLAAVGVSREDLLLSPDRPLGADAMTSLEAMLRRRERREPLAYILGEQWFYGLPFFVSPAVLIPRPETELLVETALSLGEAGTEPSIADIGTGSGCIAVALAVHLPHAMLLATDLAPTALAIARRNAERHGVAERVRFFEGDLLAPLPKKGHMDMIVSNPPYIAPEELANAQPEVRDWEPRMALGERPDALHFYRRLAAESPPYLRPGGWLIVEVGQGQATLTAEIMETSGFRNLQILPDLAGIARVVCGRLIHV